MISNSLFAEVNHVESMNFQTAIHPQLDSNTTEEKEDEENEK